MNENTSKYAVTLRDKFLSDPKARTWTSDKANAFPFGSKLGAYIVACWFVGSEVVTLSE